MANINVAEQGISYIVGINGSTYYAIKCSDGSITTNSAFHTLMNTIIGTLTGNTDRTIVIIGSNYIRPTASVTVNQRCNIIVNGILYPTVDLGANPIFNVSVSGTTIDINNYVILKENNLLIKVAPSTAINTLRFYFKNSIVYAESINGSKAIQFDYTNGSITNVVIRDLTVNNVECGIEVIGTTNYLSDLTIDNYFDFAVTSDSGSVRLNGSDTNDIKMFSMSFQFTPSYTTAVGILNDADIVEIYNVRGYDMDVSNKVYKQGSNANRTSIFGGHPLYGTYIDIASGSEPLRISRNLRGSGTASVANGGTIAHGCVSTPKVQITVNESTPIPVSYTVDATNITVYHSSEGSVTVSWRAEV